VFRQQRQNSQNWVGMHKTMVVVDYQHQFVDVANKQLERTQHTRLVVVEVGVGNGAAAGVAFAAATVVVLVDFVVRRFVTHSPFLLRLVLLLSESLSPALVVRGLVAMAFVQGLLAFVPELAVVSVVVVVPGVVLEVKDLLVAVQVLVLEQLMVCEEERKLLWHVMEQH